MSREQKELVLTGERTLPGIARENYWFQRHLVAYRLAADMARGKNVLDVGCGEGYGPALLAGNAVETVGVDIAPEAVEHAKATYTADNLSYAVMDVNRLDFPDGSFDLVVSLQVVEHLAETAGYFEQIARVLKPGGSALFTTPNRLTISPGSDVPVNPYHLREYTPGEFGRVLSAHFETVRLSGIFHAGWLKLNEKVRLVDFTGVYTMSRLNPRFWTHRLLTPLVNCRHFTVSGEDIERCLDIVAVCENGGPAGARAVDSCPAGAVNRR